LRHNRTNLAPDHNVSATDTTPRSGERSELTGYALWQACAARRVPRSTRASFPIGWENASRRGGTSSADVPAVLAGICSVGGAW
jgi:hypothetical protein